MKRIIVLFAALAVIFASCAGIRENGFDETDPLTDIAEVMTEQTEPVTEEAEPRVISLIAAGDNIVYYGNVRDAAKGDGTYDFKPTYSDVAGIISSADIAFINQETLMCGKGFDFSYYPMFNGPQDMGLDLCELGFDVINIANNHMLDKGEAGLLATIDFWRSQPVLLVGGYVNDEDYSNIRIMEKDGVRIAFLAYTYATNGLFLPAGAKTVVPYFDEETIKDQVKYAKSVSDFIIVSAHWGDEYQFTPNEEQIRYAHLFADLGVDLVIGSHPHVIQKIEWIKSSDGTKEMLCAYSLGNFVAEMSRDVNMLGGFLSLNIVSDSSGVHIEQILFIPTVFDFTTTFYNNHVYLLSEYTDEMARAHGIRAYGHSTNLKKLYGYLTDNIDIEFLSDVIIEKAEQLQR